MGKTEPLYALYVPLLFHIDKSSLGVSRIGVATLWDDFPYAMPIPILSSVLVLIGFF